MKAIISSAFIAASAAILLLLGLLHLLYTFRGTKLHPRDTDLAARMMTIPPLIMRGIRMWRAWIGFNASHSFCLIFFGAVYGYLAIRHRGFLLHSWFLVALLLGYVALTKLYFFRRPFLGVVFAAALYLLGIVLHLVERAAVDAIRK